MPSKRILELNPKHPLIVKMAGRANVSGASDALKDVAWLLLDQARLIDGETLADPTAFGKRISSVLAALYEWLLLAWSIGSVGRLFSFNHRVIGS